MDLGKFLSALEMKNTTLHLLIMQMATGSTTLLIIGCLMGLHGMIKRHRSQQDGTKIPITSSSYGGTGFYIDVIKSTLLSGSQFGLQQSCLYGGMITGLNISIGRRAVSS